MQLNIEANDQGSPPRKISMTIYINVQRSTRAPRFENQPYEKLRIAETTRVGSSIFTSGAHDPDLQGEITFRIVGDYPSPSFFRINDRTGEISVRRDLKSDNLKSVDYTVGAWLRRD